MKCLQDHNLSNVYNNNKVRREASRHFRKKRRISECYKLMNLKLRVR